MSSKKEDLMHTAEILFYDYGFHSIGLKKIVSESNIAMMTMYNHFESKEDLVLEVLKRREERYMDHMNFFTDYFRDNEIKAGSVYVRIAAAHARWIAGYAARGCMFLRAKEEYGAEPGHPVVQLADGHKRRLREFVQAADSARPSRDVVRLCLLMEGATALSESEDPSAVAEELVAAAEQLFARRNRTSGVKNSRADVQNGRSGSEPGGS